MASEAADNGRQRAPPQRAVDRGRARDRRTVAPGARRAAAPLAAVQRSRDHRAAVRGARAGAGAVPDCSASNGN